MKITELPIVRIKQVTDDYYSWLKKYEGKLGRLVAEHSGYQAETYYMVLIEDEAIYLGQTKCDIIQEGKSAYLEH